MEAKKGKIRCILQHRYDQEENAKHAVKKRAFMDTTVSNATAKYWLQCFRSGNVNVEDETRSGRPIVENVNKIIETV